MIRLRATRRISHDGALYEEGALLSAERDAAAALVACGAAVVVADADEEAAEPEGDAEDASPARKRRR